MSRYWKTGNVPADTIKNGNSIEVERMYCEPIEEKDVPETMHNLEYHTTRVGPHEYGPHPDLKDDTKDIHHIVLEDDAVVSYQWFKWSEQPTMIQLREEFPEIYTSKEINRMQLLVEGMQKSYDKTKTVLKYDKKKIELANIEPSLIVEPPLDKKVGFVPIVFQVQYPNRPFMKSKPLEEKGW